MDSRPHAYLDGELPLDALSPAERDRAAALQGLIDTAAVHLRQCAVPDLTSRVMAALPTPAVPVPAVVAEQPSAPIAAVRRLAAWLWNPQPIRLQLRPVVAFATFALLLVASLGLWSAAPSDPQPALVSETVAPPVYVQFRLDAPDAKQVTLAGSFTDWEPRYDLVQTSPGVWSVLVPLKPGVHDYTFVVDGVRWIPDPNAPQVPDHFGGANSRLTLLPPRNDT
jgi:hypothetical protein